MLERMILFQSEKESLCGRYRFTLFLSLARVRAKIVYLQRKPFNKRTMCGAARCALHFCTDAGHNVA
jgi:hypothetical protein